MSLLRMFQKAFPACSWTFLSVTTCCVTSNPSTVACDFTVSVESTRLKKSASKFFTASAASKLPALRVWGSFKMAVERSLARLVTCSTVAGSCSTFFNRPTIRFLVPSSLMMSCSSCLDFTKTFSSSRIKNKNDKAQQCSLSYKHCGFCNNKYISNEQSVSSDQFSPS